MARKKRKKKTRRRITKDMRIRTYLKSKFPRLTIRKSDVDMFKRYNIILRPKG